MCGITGFIDFTKRVTRELIENQTNSLTHRGPDSFGCEFVREQNYNIGLGHRRLSIIDLNDSGKQPMSFRDWIIVFNGEIYNYQIIRQELKSLGHVFTTNSDTEVILQAFDEWGVDAVSKFIGMFAFSIYNILSKKLYLFRDRAGVKPLYLYKREGLIVFASELKAITANPYVKREISVSSVFTFFKYGYIPAPDSIYTDVKKVMPGHYIEIDLNKRGEYNEVKYWDALSYYKNDIQPIEYNECKNELTNLLTNACSLRMIADVPVGVFLSGGYDSSLVAALLQTSTSNKIKTFSIGFPLEKYNESNYAKKVANFLGTEHSEYMCTLKEAQSIIPELPYYYDEPFGDSSSIPTILVSRLAAKSVKVALSADGGDELFCGYNKYTNAIRFNAMSKKVPVGFRPIVSKLLSHFPYKVAAKLRNKDTDRSMVLKLAEAVRQNFSIYESAQLINHSVHNDIQLKMLFKNEYLDFDKPNNNFDRIEEISLNSDMNKMLAIDYLTYMMDDILTKVDRATMSVSLEGREPLLDHRILEFTASIPEEYKLKNGVKKFILKDIVHDMIPKSIMDRPKMGFGIPVVDWMRRDLKNVFDEVLNNYNLTKHPFLNQERILLYKQRYYNGDNSYFNLLWYIFNYIMWYEKWN